MTNFAYLVVKVTLGAENLGRSEHLVPRTTRDSRIIGSKLDIHIEHTSLVWTALRAWYGGFPAVETVLGGCESDGAEVFLFGVGYLTVDALHGHLGGGQTWRGRHNRDLPERTARVAWRQVVGQ